MKARRLLFDIHSWLGLKLSLLMTFILFTGTLAVLSSEMDWLFNPEMRVSVPDRGSVVSWGEVYNAATAAYPDGELQFLVHTAREFWWASEAQFRTPSGNRIRVWINPYSGEYQGATGWFNIQRFFRQAHRHLMLPNDIGIPIVTALAFPLLLTLISGLVIYKKFWRGFLKRPRFDRAPRIWLGDLHRLGALWSLWFVLLIIVTSIWYFIEEFGGSAPRFPKAEPTVARPSNLPDDFTGAELDRAIATALITMPTLDIHNIRFPSSPTGNLRIEGQTKALLVRDRANTVYIDPETLRVIGSFTAEDLSLHQRVAEMADPLHFGTWSGFAIRIVWFVFGLVLTGLSITGVYIYGLRVVRGQVVARA